jgi:predicted  nucleic acid-binding Zn-ribbon protein
MNWFTMDTSTLNVILNVLGIVLGGGALGVILTHWRGVKGLDQADVADIRSHYAAELGAMRDRDEKRDEAMRALEKHWREMVNLADSRYSECQREREELRDELAEVKREHRDELAAVKHELSGLQAQLRAASTDRVLLMEENCPKPSETAPHSLAAAKRLKENGNGNGK